MFFLCFHMFSLFSILMLFAGQTFSHLPHPTHLSCATFAKHPLCTFIAPNGQAFSQAPQATQSVLSTAAYRFDAILIPPCYKISLPDLLQHLSIRLFLFIVEHTMAKAFEVRVSNLLFKLPAHTSGIIRFLPAAGTVSACLFQSFFDCVDDFRIRV